MRECLQPKSRQRAADASAKPRARWRCQVPASSAPSEEDLSREPERSRNGHCRPSSSIFTEYDRWTWHTKTWFAFLKGVHLLLLGIVNSVLAAVFLFGVLVAFFAIAQVQISRQAGLASRGVQAVVHLAAHLLFMWGLYSVLRLRQQHLAWRSCQGLSTIGAHCAEWLGVDASGQADTLQLFWRRWRSGCASSIPSR